MMLNKYFLRFKSLSRYIDLLDYQKNELDLYFGIKCNGKLEYGIKYNSNVLLVGLNYHNQLLNGYVKLIAESDHILEKRNS